LADASLFSFNDPGALGKRTSASSHRQEEVLSPVDQSNKRKQVSESSASTARKKRRKKLLDDEVRYCEQGTLPRRSLLDSYRTQNLIRVFNLCFLVSRGSF
jgi:hypothetical protein